MHRGESRPASAEPGRPIERCKNNSGLLGVEYGISDGAVEIDMAYAGGISTIELERKADGVRRKITHSAD